MIIQMYIYIHNHQPKMQRQIPSPRHIQDTINKMYHLYSTIK